MGVEHGMSDTVLPRSDLRRGRIGLAVGKVVEGGAGIQSWRNCAGQKMVGNAGREYGW